jgi:tripartite-type tricarboxylate transporter receptor subunit TctC
VLVVNPGKLPVKNAKELQAALKAKPDFYNFASSGNGTIIHLAAEMYLDAADVKAKHIPTRSLAPWSRTSSAAKSTSAWWQ